MRALANLRNLESLKIIEYYGGGRADLEVDAGLDVLPKLGKLRRARAGGLSRGYEQSPGQCLGAEAPAYPQPSSRWRSPLRIPDAAAARMNALSELEELSLSFVLRMNLTDAGLRDIATLEKLRTLDSGSVEGYTDEGLAFLMGALPNLRVLRFSVRPASIPNQGKK